MASSQPPSHARLTLLSLLVLGLSACGGGSGGSDGGESASQAPNQPPVARISASPDEGFAPLTVSFSATSSADPDGSIAGFRWEFGDDTQATGATVSHTFTDTGTFGVTLRVTDDQGLTDRSTRSIQVRGTSVSGTIQIAPGSSVDSDVNDRFTTPVSNNTFGEAQPLDNPVRLGGFANQPGTGSSDGNFFAGGDPEDIFAVELDGDERIVLSIGNPDADLDLELYSSDAEPDLIDASVDPSPDNGSPNPTEDLEAPEEPGSYFVRVVAAGGASTYILSIDEDEEPTALRRRARRLTDPFVPGEVLMAETARAPVQRYGIRPAHGGGGLRLEALDQAAAGPDVHFPELKLPAGAAISPAMRTRYRTLLAARHLGVHRDAPVAEVNVLRKPLRTPNDEFYDRQWHYRTIDLEEAWDITTGAAVSGPPIVVAVVDTGVLLEHPDLRDKFLRDAGGRVVGYDFIRDPERANDGDGIDPDPDDPGDDSRGQGSGSFHGTHVAGTVAADSNNAEGVAGVSWEARIMPLRALGVDGGTTFDVIQAVRYAGGLSNISGTAPPRRADIINLSLGSDFFSEAEQETLNQVRAEGVFLVASAGNDQSNVPVYPASYDGVVSVSATAIDDSAAPYSNFGQHVDVAAPGGTSTGKDNDRVPDAVLSTFAEGGDGSIAFGYGYLTGTSMAAPHVSGVIALMKSVHPDLTPDELDALLQSGRLTDEAGPPGRDDRFGWGIINGDKAVRTAQASQGDELGPIIAVSAGTLNFQAFLEELEFSVTRVGEGEVQVTVSEDVPWLELAQVSDAQGDGFGQYHALVDRSALTDGTHRGTITIEPDRDDVDVQRIGVVLRVVSRDPSADAGQHYVVLTDPDRDESLTVEIVTARNGQYEFELPDVAPGEYRLFAGTDLDDDDFICDGGEACGAYPSLSSPEILQVEPGQVGLSGLSFPSEFRTTATPTAAGGEAERGERSGLSIAKPGDPGRDR